MMTLTLTKMIIVSVLLSVVMGSFVYFLKDWHYNPINEYEKSKKIDTQLIQDLQKIVSKAYSELYTCEEKLPSVGVQGYIEGIGERNETFNSTLDNLNS